MNEEVRSVHLAGSTVTQSCHACAFFQTREEEERILLPFIKDGIEQRDKIIHIINERYRDERLKRIRESGVDVDTAEESGVLEVRPWESAYLRQGKFDQFAMLELLEKTLEKGRREYGKTRLWANMEWSLEVFPGFGEIVEYECRIHDVLANYDDPVICAYDLSIFNATLIMDILRTHPMVIVGGILQENPFFVPPAQFLEELRARRQ